MNRRGFLTAILAAGAAPAVISIGRLMLPRPIATQAWGLLAIDTNPLFSGELGSYNGVILGLNDPRAVKRFAAALFADVQRKSYFNRAFMGHRADSPIIIHPRQIELLR
jgi:hypothetical protein